MKERIIEMLGRGITASQVAMAVGCDDSYISQLMADENIAEQVQKQKAEHFAGYMDQDARADAAEKLALDRMITLIPFVTKPAEAARVYSVLNAAKRRTAENVSAAVPVAQTVQLDLPEASRVRFTMTHDRQVIEIEGRSLATMPAKSLAARLEQRNAARLLSTDVPSRLGQFNASQQRIQEVDSRLAPTKASLPLSEQL